MIIYDNLPKIIEECPIWLDKTTVYSGMYQCAHYVCIPCGMSWTMNYTLCRTDGLFYEPPIEECDKIKNYSEYDHQKRIILKTIVN